MSANRVTCPHCNAVLRLAAEMSEGKRIKCPKCATSFFPVTEDVEENIPVAVARPRPAPADDDEDVDEAPLERPRFRPKRKKNESKAAVILVSIVLGAVLVVGGGMAAVLLLIVRPALKHEPVAQASAPADPAVMAPKVLFPPANPNPPAPRRPSNPGGIGLEVGNLAMEINGEDIDGTTFRLSDYRGKVVVIDFWGNW